MALSKQSATHEICESVVYMYMYKRYKSLLFFHICEYNNFDIFSVLKEKTTFRFLCGASLKLPPGLLLNDNVQCMYYVSIARQLSAVVVGKMLPQQVGVIK